METLVFVLVAHWAAQPHVQVKVFDPSRCYSRTPAECMVGAYDACRSEEDFRDRMEENAYNRSPRCESMDRTKADPLVQP
jgi:hypothetical protein